MRSMISQSVSSIIQAFTAVASLWIGYYAFGVFGKMYLNPLNDVPGPFLSRITGFWELLVTARGRNHEWYVRMHERYGPVVRIAPNRYSFNKSEDMRSIYSGNLEKSQYYDAFGDPDQPPPWSVRDKREREIRKRGYSNLYSRAWTRDFEIVVSRKIGVLKDRLAGESRRRCRFSVPKLFNCFVFDIMSSITLGKDFDALGKLRDTTGVVNAVENAFWYSCLFGHVPQLYRGLLQVGYWLGIRPPIVRLLDRVRHLRPGRNVVDDLSDSFLKRLLHFLDEDGTNRQVIEDCCFSNVVLGVAKLSISLSAAIYYIYRQPEVLRRLRQEIERSSDPAEFSEPDKSEELPLSPYLQAVIRETLRLHPAVGTMLPRIVPAGGLRLAGYDFPEGTVVGVNPWAAYRNVGEYGKDASDFRPERWLDKGDSPSANMFSFNDCSRDCPGGDICQMVMRKLIVEMVRDFDVIFSLADASVSTYSGWFVWLDYECLVQPGNRA